LFNNFHTITNKVLEKIPKEIWEEINFQKVRDKIYYHFKVWKEQELIHINPRTKK